MPKLPSVCLLVFLLPTLGGALAQEPSCLSPADDAACESFGDARHVQEPQRVLIVPLLRKMKDSAESERWPENPAARIAALYRDTYRAQVVWLREVREWEDYYDQIDGLLRQSAIFDRVIFVGHGGFDGPILNQAVFRQSFEANARGGVLSRGIETQPGVQQSLAITYDTPSNPAFSDYIATHWRELLALDTDPVPILSDLEARLQPVDASCSNRCLAEASAAGVDRLAACDSICRDALFTTRWALEAAPERFWLFADKLRSLVAARGLILLGFCNPGSMAYEGEHTWDSDGLLVHSSLAGGPHETYVHLLAAATGRTAAGPIGKTSADDIVARIGMLERSRFQRYLRIVAPPAAGYNPQ